MVPPTQHETSLLDIDDPVMAGASNAVMADLLFANVMRSFLPLIEDAHNRPVSAALQNSQSDSLFLQLSQKELSQHDSTLSGFDSEVRITKLEQSITSQITKTITTKLEDLTKSLEIPKKLPKMLKRLWIVKTEMDNF